MRLKEAQLLGVLAVIALLVIIACMWRNDEPAAARASDTTDITDVVTPAAGDSGAREVLDDMGNWSSFDDDGTGDDTWLSEAERRDSLVNDINIGTPLENEDPLRALRERDPVVPVTPPVRRTDDVRPITPLPPSLHVVQAGETLIGISRKYYGADGKWQALLKANRSLISRPEDLRVGMKLVVPPVSAEEPAATVHVAAGTPNLPAGAKLHKVAQGEVLSTISQKYYGTSRRWKFILEANPAQMKTDRDLRAGMEIIIPALPAGQMGDAATLNIPARTIPTGAKVYEVQKGDTLWSIAAEHYGDGLDYKKIKKANEDILNGSGDIQPGMKLVLP